MFRLFRKPTAPAEPAGPDAAEWRSRGNAALGRGALAEAEDCYRRALAADPGDAPSRVNLGYVLLERGAVAEAIGCLREAAGSQHADAAVRADAGFLLARTHEAQGAASEAIAAYRAALQARPDFDEALQAVVPLLVAAQRAPEAVALARAAVEAGRTPQRLMLLARALHATGEVEAALGALDQLLADQPGDPGAHESRGNLLMELGRPAEALAAFESALAHGGAAPEALANLAAALLRLGRAQEALARAEEALALQPAHRQALHAKGNALLTLLRVREAAGFAGEACLVLPDDADLQWNLAVAHLLLGDFETGWAAHEARWRATGFVHGVLPAVLAAPRWTGREPLADATLLLYAEQGLGDTIQFLRYVPDVARQARHVLLQVQPAVAPLLGALPPNVRLLAPGEPLPAFDRQCPLLSLPHALGTRLETIPAAVPYLQADPPEVRAWRERLPGGAQPKVGIAWSGNPRHANDHNRSIALQAFAALAAPGVQFVSLQPQVRETDRPAFAQWPDLYDVGPRLHDFRATAGLLEALDLVITVDTSVAHLAGALGRPVWILLPHAPDWRWLLERADSPWYPTARLYRQPAPGDWESVLARVRRELETLLP